MATRKPPIQAAAPQGQTIEMPEGWQMQVPPRGAQLPVMPDDGSELEFNDEPETALDRVLAQIGESRADAAIVKLYRITRENPRGDWCGEYSPSEYSEGGLGMIARQHGPGKYFIWIYGPNEFGKTVRLGRDDFTIAQSAITQAAQNPIQNAPSETALMLQEMQKQNAAILQALSQRQDPMQGLQQTMTLMMQMKELMGATGAVPEKKSSIGEIVEAIKEIKGVQSLIGGEDKEPKSELETMLSALGPIAEVVKASMQRGQNPVPAIQQPMLPAPQPVADNPFAFFDQLTPERQQSIMQELLQALAELLAMAARSADPEEGGAFIAEKLPDEMLDFLERPDCVDALCLFQPQCAPHREWLVQAVQIANEILDAPEEPDTVADASPVVENASPAPAPLPIPGATMADPAAALPPAVKRAKPAPKAG